MGVFLRTLLGIEAEGGESSGGGGGVVKVGV